MKYNIVIKNGTVIDPARKSIQKKDIYICHDKITEIPSADSYTADQVIDAGGYFVTPGIIENHTHLYEGGTVAGLNPDIYLLPNGITAAFDQGSCGTANFESFYTSTICHAKVDVKAYLNVSSTGIPCEVYPENIDPAHYDREMIKYLFQKYSGTLIGLKIRLGKESERGMGFVPLEETIKLAEEIGCPVSVHIKHPSAPVKKYASLLRKGDIWVHMYQPGENTVLDPGGNVYPEILKAKQRGVLFDTASGRSGFSLDLVRRALAQGFTPDFLGTDSVSFNVYKKPLFGLVYVMSMYLNLGYSLEEVISLCTLAPARTIHEENTLATLKAGTTADIAILEVKEMPITFSDRYGGLLNGTRLLIPRLTIKKGQIMYRSIEF